MAIPVNSDLNGMDFIFEGQPFVQYAAKASTDLRTMDCVFEGQPFVSNPAAVENPEPELVYNAILFGMMF